MHYSGWKFKSKITSEIAKSHKNHFDSFHDFSWEWSQLSFIYWWQRAIGNVDRKTVKFTKSKVYKWIPFLYKLSYHNKKSCWQTNSLELFSKVRIQMRGTNGHVNYAMSWFFLPWFFVITQRNACLKAQYLFLWSELQTKAPFSGASSGVKSLHFCWNISLLAQMIFPSVRTPSIFFFLKSYAKFSCIFNKNISNFCSILVALKINFNKVNKN